MASVMAPRERRIGQQQPTPWCDAIGLVVETFREQFGQVLDRGCSQQARVNRRHAVGAVRADDGQIGHADFPNGPFFDEADVCHAALRPQGSATARHPAAGD